MKKDIFRVNLFLMVVLVVVVYSVISTPHDSYSYTVSGDSMFPTLSNHDIIETVKQKSSDISYGIYVLEVPNEYVEDTALSNRDSTMITKRVIGLPDDIISYMDGDLYVNGYQPFEDSDYFFTGDDLTVSDGCVYVIGDNFSQSFDSRYFGELPITSEYVYQVIGDK